MGSQEQMNFNNLKSNLSNSIKESCLSSDALIYKIADEVHQINTLTVEPGVEIARGLSAIVDTTIGNAARSGCDLTAIIKGILIGAFRSNRSIRSEAHKTIHLLVKEIVEAAFKYNCDVTQLTDGLLAAVVLVAKEQELNAQELLLITFEDVLSSSKELDPGFARKVASKIPQEYEGWQVVH